MKNALAVVLLAFPLSVSATLIAYDYEGVVVSTRDKVVRDSDSSGSIIFDTSLFGIKKFTLNFDNHRLTWQSRDAYRLDLTAKPGPIQYLGAAPGAGFHEAPDHFSIAFQWEVYVPAPVTISTVLSNFDHYWSEETPLYIEGPEPSELLFRSVGPAYQVLEPVSLSILTLGLCAIWARKRIY